MLSLTLVISELTTELTHLKPVLRQDPMVKHALALRSAWAMEDYHKFFRLYQSAPKMTPYLIDMFVERERKSAVKKIIKSYVYGLCCDRIYVLRFSLLCYDLCDSCCVFVCYYLVNICSTSSVLCVLFTRNFVFRIFGPNVYVVDLHPKQHCLSAIDRLSPLVNHPLMLSPCCAILDFRNNCKLLFMSCSCCDLFVCVVVCTNSLMLWTWETIILQKCIKSDKISTWNHKGQI